MAARRCVAIPMRFGSRLADWSEDDVDISSAPVSDVEAGGSVSVSLRVLSAACLGNDLFTMMQDGVGCGLWFIGSVCICGPVGICGIRTCAPLLVV